MMRLKELLKEIEIIEMKPGHDVEVKKLSIDSRDVSDGSLFFAIKGERSDGHNFIGEAFKARACAAVHDRPLSEEILRQYNERPLVRVVDTRGVLGRIADTFYGRPSTALKTIGITGTNGKTTTTYLIKEILEAGAVTVGLLGTIKNMIGKRDIEAVHTTPDAHDYHRLLREMLDAGCSHVISEVSSHGLVQGRVESVTFDVGIFTNLTRDHLDYHHDMETYYLAKKLLFIRHLKENGVAVINIDDEYGERLYRELDCRRLTYGIDNEADVMALDIKTMTTGLKFDILYKGDRYPVRSNLMSRVNVYNILAAFSAAASIGVSKDDILSGIGSLHGVEGRFEPVECGQDFMVIVDYAHTDDALSRLIKGAREITDGKIVTVFGCGGDRDRGKRGLMGYAATSQSDITIITTDNPRTERPDIIFGDIIEGVKGEYTIEPDRSNAIAMAIGMAETGDTVLIAGKGHEEYQDRNGIRYPFSDRSIAKECIRRRLNQDGHV